MKNRLMFSPRLYLGEGIPEKKLDIIKKKLVFKPLLANVYIITFAGNPADQLEFFDARQMIQRYYREHTVNVIGIAKNYDDAVTLIEKITQECIDKRGDCELKEYLLC